jgi:hypothetical protein
MTAKKSNTKYIVVSETELTSFIEIIQQYIDSGYSTLGGVSTTHSPRHNSQIVYTQALVKEDK